MVVNYLFFRNHLFQSFTSSPGVLCVCVSIRLAHGKCGCNILLITLFIISRIDFHMKLHSSECHRTPLMIGSIGWCRRKCSPTSMSPYDVTWPQWVKLKLAELGLTLNVRGPSYLGLTRSVSWLLMPWLLTSPGHQQPWFWLCRIGKFLSYLRKDFNYLRSINVEKWHKM